MSGELLPVVNLTGKKYEVLSRMERGEELVYERGGGWWIGDDKTNAKLALALIRYLTVALDRFSDDSFERWHITETGKMSLETKKLYILVEAPVI